MQVIVCNLEELSRQEKVQLRIFETADGADESML
jgi:hypothetical protein